MSDWLIEETGEPLVPELPEDHHWRDEERDDDDSDPRDGAWVLDEEGVR